MMHLIFEVPSDNFVRKIMVRCREIRLISLPSLENKFNSPIRMNDSISKYFQTAGMNFF